MQGVVTVAELLLIAQTADMPSSSAADTATIATNAAQGTSPSSRQCSSGPKQYMDNSRVHAVQPGVATDSLHSSCSTATATQQALMSALSALSGPVTVQQAEQLLLLVGSNQNNMQLLLRTLLQQQGT